MLTIQPSEQGQPEKQLATFLQTSSRKIIAIGASLRVWLRAVDRIVFSKEVTHQPDPKLIEELTAILLSAETKKPRRDD